MQTSGESLGNLVARIAMPVQSELPPPLDNTQSLCRLRCFMLNYQLKPLPLALTARHYWPK